MKIELAEITVRELFKDYKDDSEGGVFGYGGKLDIRPPYQREFVYKDKQRDAVISTVFKNYPLNVMYWAVRDDGKFEVIDGQQRTISLCQYIKGDFSFEDRYFQNLQPDEKARVLDYKLMIYRCTGSDSERLAWFKIINISGLELTQQELRNAVYAGPWLSDAKRYFSRTNSPAKKLGGDYITARWDRQEGLETVIEWINDGEVEDYMGKHQEDTHANELWLYFQKIVSWIQATFPHKRKEMRSVPWGALYKDFCSAALDPTTLEARVAALMADDEVSSKSGIYSYVLNGQEKHLNIRKFTPTQRREAYERQKGLCAKCKKPFELEVMEADHTIQWSDGGKTTAENCRMLCKPCHYAK